MFGLEPVYWPFSVLPPEQRTEQHWKEIRFLEEAFHDGMRPCKFMDGEYRVEASGGRSGLMIYRGRQGTRWEVFLNDQRDMVLSFWVDQFESASCSVLQWLRGGSSADILADVADHIIRGPRFGQPTAGVHDDVQSLPANRAVGDSRNELL